MREGVKCVLFTATQANANRIRDALTARLPANVTIVTPPFAARYHDGRFYASCSFLLDDETRAGQFLADVQSLWTSGTDASRIVAGSHVRHFRSREDEGASDEHVERRTK